MQRRAYDHSRGCYYAVVETNSGRQVVVTSAHYNGPYRASPDYELHPQARVG